jgi:hypothetical protein
MEASKLIVVVLIVEDFVVARRVFVGKSARVDDLWVNIVKRSEGHVRKIAERKNATPWLSVRYQDCCKLPRSCEIGKMALECLSKKKKIRMRNGHTIVP